MFGAMTGVFPPAKKAKGKGGKAIATAGGQASGTGEIRFDHAHSALKALGMLNGSNMLGSTLMLELDPNSKDQTKLIIQGIPEGAEWQELKDHFAAVGDIAHTEVHGAKKHGPKLTGEIRYDDVASAQQAMTMLQGSAMGDSIINITLDANSKDGTKLVVTGVPAGSGWQELKDHFAQAGMVVAYSGIKANANTPVVGEVRYDDPTHSMQAMQNLNGSMLGGSQIFIQQAPGSQDGTKLLVTGLTAATQWQELKDHFAVIGTVAFANTSEGKGGKSIKGAKGAAKGMGGGMGNMFQMGQMMGGGGMGGGMGDMMQMMQMMQKMQGGGNGMGMMQGGGKGMGMKGGMMKGKGKGKGKGKF